MWLSNFRYHIHASELLEIIGEKSWDDHLSFGVCRNPYDRVLSYFKYVNKTPEHHLYNVYEEFKDFRDYVSNLHKFEWNDEQYHYLTKGDKIIVNRVLKFENIEDDFRHLIGELNLPQILLEKYNASRTNNNFMGFYNSEMIRTVNDIFSKDFEIFGYEKVIP